MIRRFPEDLEVRTQTLGFTDDFSPWSAGKKGKKNMYAGFEGGNEQVCGGEGRGEVLLTLYLPSPWSYSFSSFLSSLTFTLILLMSNLPP